MTLAEIRNKVMRRVDDDDIDEDLLNDAINEAYMTVVNDSRTFWKWMQGSTTFATVANMADYTKSTIAADMDDVYEIYHTDNQLHALNRREFDQIVPEQTSTGTPTYYVEWGGTITLYPIPSDVRTMQVKYHKKATRMTLDTQEPLIPDQFQDILVVGASSMFYEADEDSTRHDRAVAKFEAMLSRMIKKNETDSDKTYSLKMAKNYKPFRDWDYQ